MKKVFVSVPMSGKDDALIERSIQITREFYLKAKGLSAEDVHFVDNFHHLKRVLKYDEKFIEKGTGGKKNPNVWFLIGAAFLLSDCDEAVFGPGWMDARGCVVEHKICATYDIPMVIMK